MSSDIPNIGAPNPASPAPEPAVKPNPFARMFGVFFNPIPTMKSVAERPDWVVPLLLILVLTFATNFIAAPRLDMVTDMREQMAENGATEEQIDEMAENMGTMQKVMGPLSVVLIPIWISLLAGVIFVAFKMFGGGGTFKQAFAVTTYAWLPLLLKGIIGTVLILNRTDVRMSELANLVKSNPAFLVDMKEQPAAFAFLSSIDVFNLFMVFLLIIGFSQLTRLSRGTSAAIVLSLWLVTVLVKTGLGSLQG